MSKIITRESIAMFLLAFILATGASVFAWTGPTQAPPDGNVFAPLNVGATSQVKSGGLWATSLGSDDGFCIGVDCITSWDEVAAASGWEAQGTDVAFITGNVGVGTTSPSRPLSVVGAVYATGGIVFGDGTTQTTTGGSMTCPAGFTMVSGQGKNMGCIQNTEQGTAVLGVAIAACFSNHGGRLPTFDELYIAFSYYTLTAEADDHEMTGTLYENAGYKSITLNGGTIGANPVTSLPYRCFIPAT